MATEEGISGKRADRAEGESSRADGKIEIAGTESKNKIHLSVMPKVDRLAVVDAIMEVVGVSWLLRLGVQGVF